MVGLKFMETTIGKCSFCNKMADTKCDKSHKAICSECASVVPVSENLSNTLIQVVAKKHAPKRHLDKLEKLAIKRGEVYE